MMNSAVAEINRECLPLPGSEHLGQWFGSKTGSYANRYEGTSACPAGQTVTARGSTQHAPKFIGGPTSTPWVECKPIPAPAPTPAPAPVAGPTYTTTISPVLQTEISPQISPVFQQVQDSPGSVQAATPTMIAPGGMEAEGGSAGGNGSAAMLEFMRAQSEQDAAQRQADTAAREAERRDREAREYAFQQAQLDFQREQARLQTERQAAIDAGAAEQAAQLEAQYQAAQTEWETTRATPGGFVSTAVMPGRTMIAPEVPAPILEGPQNIPIPLVVAGVAVLAIGGYFYMRKSAPKRKT